MIPGFRRKPDLALDLGTCATRLAVRGRGVVTEVPTVVAVQHGAGGKTVVATGIAARKMLGRTPAGTEVVRPVREGVVVDFEATENLLRAVLASAGRTFLRPQVLVCVPLGHSEVERKAVQASLRAAGAREVVLLESPLAAVVGAGLPIERPVGSMLVDVGAGRTHVAVTSLGGVVVGRSLRVAGDAIDLAIVTWLRDERGLLVGEHTAEAIKLRIGCAGPLTPPVHMRVRGRDLHAGGPAEVELDSDQIAGAIAPVVRAICDGVLAVLRETPPEIAADILEAGVILCGAGSRLRGLDAFLRDATGLPMLSADDPPRCVARGACRVLEDDALYARLVEG